MADIRIMLVDDHEVVRQGRRALLERWGNPRVVAEAGSMEEAAAFLADQRARGHE